MQRTALWLQNPCSLCFGLLGVRKGRLEGEKDGSMAEGKCAVQRGKGTHGQCSWNGCGVGLGHRSKLHQAEDVQPSYRNVTGAHGSFLLQLLIFVSGFASEYLEGKLKLHLNASHWTLADVLSITVGERR